MTTPIDAYDYDLPPDLIAQYPLLKRTDARLMIVHRQRQEILHAHVRDLPQILKPGDCLVLNETRVIPARLLGRRSRTGGRWSGLFLDHDEQGTWRVMSKTRGKLAPGETITLEGLDSRPAFNLHLIRRFEDGTWAVRPGENRSPFELLEEVGRTPLPPYIRGGAMEASDPQTYQTVYAKSPGAIAAPTAGLHFSDQLLESLRQMSVKTAKVVLHVGVGTFKPVTAETLDEHAMHSEWGSVDQQAIDTIEATKAQGKRVVSVGTTVVRVLETAAADGVLRPWTGHTDLFIRPPYQFKATEALMTNFHLPKSTLLVLVRTFGGDELLKRAYQAAIEERYRFFSYGDAMLIL